MHVIARKVLNEFSNSYPQSRKPLDSWWTICRKNQFLNFIEIKKTFGTVDLINNCLVFNIGGGKYRLVVRVNFSAQRIWIKYILSHEEYGRLDLRGDPKCR
jgi:mRNA interferase HigB